jgi:gamma-glutamyltranspeptidase / glutathione hydrolase
MIGKKVVALTGFGPPQSDVTRAGVLFTQTLIGWAFLASSALAASPPAVEARHGMAVSEHRLASEAGRRILDAGGGAVDAAVAIGYALAVVDPCCGNIGGGGFMTIHLADGRNIFLNFREKAPAAASADMYLDAAGEPDPALSRLGWRATAVPGTVMGLDHALTKYGRLKRAEVMAPAIQLARDGFELSRFDTDIIDSAVSRFSADPTARAIFLRPDGSPLQPGDRLVQPDLANSLRQIAERGPDAFYAGGVAKAVAAASKANGGLLTEQDFASYTTTEGAPLACSYRGYDILSAPPPSSGGVAMCEIFNVLNGYDMKALGFRSARSVHIMAEAMRHAFIDRNTYLGDPEFVSAPLDRLLSPAYAASIRDGIKPDKAATSAGTAPALGAGERPQTTHFSVADSEGGAVSATVTINGFFGANVMAPGTGFFLNNEMDDFTAKPGAPNMFGLVQGAANAIAPGKRPLSSMAPTLVMKNGKAALVVGSPGGPRIITTVLETIMNVVDYGMEPQEAVDAPRIHHQGWPDQIDYEPFGLSPDTISLLTGMGHTLVQRPKWGSAELIELGSQSADGQAARAVGADEAMSGAVLPGFFYGANDSRRPAGAALGR